MSTDFLNNIAETLRFKTYPELVEDLYIRSLIESFERLKKIPDIAKKTENEIRNYLAFDLENNNQVLSPLFQTKLLKLTKENTILLTATDTKRTDIEFFISGHGDFVVECKNLRSADQRYISDGADRFVNELYSKNDTDAAMIGFVVSGNVTSIMNGLTTRIGNENSFVKLYKHPTEKCSGYEYSFHSSHSRVNTTAIILHHLFLDLVPPSKN